MHLQTKTCKQCSSSFEVTDTHLTFYSKMKVLTPTLCPRCRMQRRISYRNDRGLYQTKSSLSGKQMISMYNPENNFIVYTNDEWHTDQWDPFEHGRDFNFSKNFFPQLADLKKVVPRFNLFNMDCENCEYVNYAPHCKSCYLIFGSWFNESCYYGQTLNECKNCIDNLFLDKSELCYENVNCNNCYHSFFCKSCSFATDSFFCFDCKNIQNCIGCWNIRNKQYHFFNQPVSKEEFEKKKALFQSRKSLTEIKKYCLDQWLTSAIHQYMTGGNNENITGDYIFNCKNAEFCFSVYRCLDVAFCARLFDQKDTYDFDGGGKGELAYENMSNDFAYHSIGCTTCENLTDSHYCDICFNCKNCFGCVGLRQKQYCIFNKQYTKEEYEHLVSKMIEHMKKTGEWGEFPPITLSPFAYNETLAQEYFPLSKDEAVKMGYQWFQKDDYNNYQGPKVIIPDHIKDVSDDIVKEILTCETCGKKYKMIIQELRFYRDMGLAAPAKCSNCRHSARMKQIYERQLWDRECMKCHASLKTTYAPDRKEIVYCEKCYNDSIY